jgi:hypothetical protein
MYLVGWKQYMIEYSVLSAEEHGDKGVETKEEIHTNIEIWRFVQYFLRTLQQSPRVVS